jgi:glycosyltransferase involved in cell wall biosynthesis
VKNSLISIIVPAFNEEESIAELHTRVKETFNQLNRPYEMIVIDDGSTDGTFEKLKALQAQDSNLVILRHYKNMGKSLALMQGFDAANGGIAITLDADLQDQPEEIPAFIKKIEEGYDFANGWRHQRKDPSIKRYVSKVFNILIAMIFKVKFNDVNCGLKAYSSKVYKWLDLKGDLHRLIPVIIAYKGYKVSEISVKHEERKFGESKYKLFRHRGLLDIIALAAGTTTQIRPFHYFCERGMVLLSMAALSFIVWCFSYESLPLFAQVLIAVGGLWCLSLGTLLPIFGFYLEIESSRFQRHEYRESLIKETIDSRP